MQKGIIYCVIAPNGKKYYGQTVQSFARRKQRHKRDYQKSNCVFHQALIKHQWNNFKWNIIEEYLFEDKKILIQKLNEREKYWIKMDQTYFRKFGYNMTPGGDNYIHRHVSLNENTKNKIRNSLLGIKHTDERRKNISFSLKGKTELAKNFGDTTGKNNGMFGKSVYQLWIEKYGLEEANKRKQLQSEKLSQSLKGKNKKKIEI